jgi:hypothetical protein
MMKKNLYLLLFGLVTIVLVIGGVLLIERKDKTTGPLIPAQQYSWKQSVDNYFNVAPNVSPISGDFGTFSQGFLDILKKTLNDDVKLTQSTDTELTYVAKTIIVESDAISVKNWLSQNGYQIISMAKDYSSIKAEKDSQVLEINFSVKSLDKGEINVIRSSAK